MVALLERALAATPSMVIWSQPDSASSSSVARKIAVSRVAPRPPGTATRPPRIETPSYTYSHKCTEPFRSESTSSGRRPAAVAQCEGATAPLFQDAAVLAVDPGGGAAHPAGDLAAGAEERREEPVDELLAGVLGARHGHVDRGRHRVAGLPDRGGDGAEPGDRLVPLDEVPVPPGRLELRGQRVEGGDRLRAPGAAERVGGAPLPELVGAEVGEDHLADRAEHRRDGRADADVRGHQRVAARYAGHEQDLIAVEDPQVDRLAGLGREVAQP